MIKPFNPILGETFQAVIGDYEVGVEQISHHPPITAIEIWNPKDENSPRFSAQTVYEANTGMSEVRVVQTGAQTVYFPDTKQTIVLKSYPNAYVRGLMKGTRTYDYEETLILEDEGNGVFAEVAFNPDRKGWIKRMFSSSQKTHPDHFEGVISNRPNLDYKSNRGSDFEKLKKKEGLEIYSKISGNWTEIMKIDDEVVWEYTTFKPLSLYFVNNPLPSD